MRAVSSQQSQLTLIDYSNKEFEPSLKDKVYYMSSTLDQYEGSWESKNLRLEIKELKKFPIDKDSLSYADLLKLNFISKTQELNAIFHSIPRNNSLYALGVKYSVSITYMESSIVLKKIENEAMGTGEIENDKMEWLPAIDTLIKLSK